MSRGKSGESAQVPVTHWQAQFAEQRKLCRDFLAMLDTLLESSSPGSSERPASSSCKSASRAA